MPIEADGPSPTGPADGADPAPAEEPAFRSGFVALIGRPNVGKSTILNGLVGEKVAIVTPRQQTTRRRLRGVRTTDREQVVFVDTPGIHDPKTELGRFMVETARTAATDADVVVFVVDVSVPPTELDRSIAGLIRQAGQPVVLAMNKSDMLKPEHILERSEAYVALAATDDWVLTIGVDSHNLGELWRLIVKHLPEGPAYYDDDVLTDQPERELAAELVRESAMRYLRDEVPHGMDVSVTSWSERDDGLVEIAATIIVERDSQKGIVIGSGGRMLKQIGTRARHEIERAVGRRVYLALVVQTRRGWRQDSAQLRELGYS